MKTIIAIFRDSVLRKRVLFVIGILIITRILSVVPIPGVETQNLASFLQSGFGSFLNIFSGGGLASFSIVMLGVGPYITASIIMQLMTVLSPRLKEMNQEEGNNGRRRRAGSAGTCSTHRSRRSRRSGEPPGGLPPAR